MTTLASAYGSAGADGLAVRRISAADLDWALREGWNDFREKRGDILMVGLIYPVFGLVASWLAASRSPFHLIFPLAVGAAILGPAIASGYYELARRREQGQDSSWRHWLDPFFGPCAGAIAVLSLVLLALFSAWMGAAWAIYELTIGGAPAASAGDFIRALFTTPEGWTMIVAGNVVGALFATVALAISFVSFPMAIDRQGGARRSILKSVEAFLKNPRVTILWGARVVGLLVVASIPLFVGLAIVLPLLGYATWHLYTRTVER